MMYHPIVLDVVIREYQEARFREANDCRLVRQGRRKTSAWVTARKRIVSTGRGLIVRLGRHPSETSTRLPHSAAEGYQV